MTAYREIAETIIRAMAPPDRRPIWEWANDYVRLGTAYTLTGPFDITRSRHLIEPLERLQDNHTRVITIRAPVRGQKTLTADIWLPWCIANDPGPFMWSSATDDLASIHAEERLMQILRDCGPVRALFPTDRYKLREEGIQFSNGMHFEIQGSALSGFQAKGRRYQVNDECWLWKPGRLGEAMSRVGDFERVNTSKVLNLSQGGTDDDEFEKCWQRGHQAEWCVQCAACGQYMQALICATRSDGSKWGLVWDEYRLPSGDWDVNKCKATVRFECERCGHKHPHNAGTLAHWNLTGKYIPSNPEADRSHASYHWTALITRPWDLLCEDFCYSMNAWHQGVAAPRIEFTQKREALPWSESKFLSQFKHAVANYDPKSDWKDELCRVFTVDCQIEGVFWGVIRAWSKSGESRRLWFGKLYSWDEIRARQLEFKVNDRMVMIDSGYDTKTVYYFARLYNWLALKGEEDKYFLHPLRRNGRVVGNVRRSYSQPVKGDPERGEAKQGRRFCDLVRWSNPTVKDILDKLIKGKGAKWLTPSAGTDQEMEKEYTAQIASEYKKKIILNKETGAYKWDWVCPSGNNHARDCECMQVLGAILMECLPDFDYAQKQQEPLTAP